MLGPKRLLACQKFVINLYIPCRRRGDPSFRVSILPRCFTSLTRGNSSPGISSLLLESSVTTREEIMRTAVLVASVAFWLFVNVIPQPAGALPGSGQSGDISNLADSKIVAGLKQALRLSTAKAVALTGRPDGFLKNDAIKIALPPQLEPLGRVLRIVGMGEKVSKLAISMNRDA